MTNPNQLPLKEIQDKIDKARSILILLPAMQTIDSVSASLAFYLALIKSFESKETKPSVSIASATQMTVAYQRLYGVNDISQSLGTKNLVISLKTTPENIEKVSVDEGSNDFNIIIETKPGVGKINDKDVSFSYKGLDADLVITIGLPTADAAGSLYTDNQNLYSDREVVVICGNNRATGFGTLNVLEPEASGTSELVAKLLRFLKMPIDGDICTNLIAGIESATANFAQKTTADTFAAIAWCMKEGGRRNHLSMPIAQQPGFGGVPSYGNPSPFMPGMGQNIYNPQANFAQPMYPQPMAQPIMPAPNQIPLVSQGNDQNNDAPESDGEASDDDHNTPNDWLQPKIYRGGQQ